MGSGPCVATHRTLSPLISPWSAGRFVVQGFHSGPRQGSSGDPAHLLTFPPPPSTLTCEVSVSFTAVLRFVSAWKVLPPLSHLSAGTSHTRWPCPPALRAVQPSSGPAWAKEVPSGRGQGLSVHLDAGITELRRCHRNDFGRREVPRLPARFLVSLASKSDTVFDIQLLGQVDSPPEESLPNASSGGVGLL